MITKEQADIKINEIMNMNLSNIGRVLTADKELKNFLDSETFHIETDNYSEKLYIYMNNFNPICVNNKKKVFISFNKGYRNGCGPGKNCPCSQESRKKKSTEWNKNNRDLMVNNQRIAFYNRLVEYCKTININPKFTLEEYKGMSSGWYDFTCNICNHTWKQNLDNGNSPICKSCNPSSSSREQDEVYEYIKSILPKNTPILVNDKSILDYNYELDIVIPNLNIAIEYHGLYWHSDDVVDKGYHRRKLSLCFTKGYDLLSIFSDEWRYKKDIVKSILRNKLKCENNYIHGRTCYVKEISFNETNDFLIKNHIQGPSNPASISLGLFHQNELVSIMTFGKERLYLGGSSAENTYELYRLCSNKRVNGGFSKLLNYFIKKYKPKKIITYCDARWSNGNIYYKLGFKYDSHSKPGYWWFNKNSEKRFHRSKFTKQKLIKEGYDPEKSEDKIMKERGFLKVYDCGNRKFIMEI